MCVRFVLVQTRTRERVRVRGGEARVCVNGLSLLAVAVRVYTHCHPLTSLYAPAGNTLSSPPPCVYRADTQYPDLLYVLYAEGNPVSIFHHGDQACPHSFFISSKLAQCCLFAGSVRDMVVSEQVSSPLDKRVVQHPFHLDSLSGVHAPENMARKKKQHFWRLSWDVCWLLLSLTSLMCASWKLVKNTPLDSSYIKGCF